MVVGSATLAVGAFLGGAAQKGSAPAPDAPEVVQARRFEVVDELGTVMMVVGSNKDGGSISIRDRFGKTMLLATAAETGGTLVLTNSKSGQPAFVATSTEHGGAAQVLNSQGKAVVESQALAKGASISIADAAGRTNVALSADDTDGGLISTFSNSGTAAARLFSNVAGDGVLETYRTNGDPLVSLSSTEGGHGQISTFWGIGKPLVTLTATANHEGQFYTFDGENHPMIALASSPAGPTLRVFNRAGDPLAILEADDSGNGSLALWRKDGTGKAITP
jgi:hypothetical protein